MNILLFGVFIVVVVAAVLIIGRIGRNTLLGAINISCTAWLLLLAGTFVTALLLTMNHRHTVWGKGIYTPCSFVFTMAVCAVIAFVLLVITRHILNYRRHSSVTSWWQPFIAIVIELGGGVFVAIFLYFTLGLLAFLTGFLPI